MALMCPLRRGVKTQTGEIDARWQKTQGHALDAEHAE